MQLIYGSVCSGIEAATQAWEPLGWEPAFFSEIAKFPKAVLRHHYPKVPLHGDFQTIKAKQYGPIDVLVGGTPCQDFSIAGLRAGVAGERGNLTLEFLRLAARKRPRWLVWENVPGALSALSHAAPDPCPPPPPLDLGCDGAEVATDEEYDSEELHAFNCLLAGLSELGYGFAYRVLDAQHFELAQRRARLFVVGYLGDWRRAAAVLFEWESLSGHPAPRRETGQRVAGTIAPGAHPGGFNGRDADAVDNLIPAVAGPLGSTSPGGGFRTTDIESGAFVGTAFGGNNTTGSIDLATAVRAKGGSGHGDFESETFVAHAFKAAHYTRGKDGKPSDIAPSLSADADKGDQDTLICFDTTQITQPNNRSNPQPGDPSPPLAPSGHVPAIATREHLAAFADLADPVCANQGGKYTHEGRGNFRVSNVAIGRSSVRRLTPRECERLQGFPDDFTLVPWRKGMAPDGLRYAALGNSMPVPVMRWLGERIEKVEAMEPTPLK